MQPRALTSKVCSRAQELIHCPALWARQSIRSSALSRIIRSDSFAECLCLTYRLALSAVRQGWRTGWHCLLWNRADVQAGIICYETGLTYRLAFVCYETWLTYRLAFVCYETGLTYSLALPAMWQGWGKASFALSTMRQN